ETRAGRRRVVLEVRYGERGAEAATGGRAGPRTSGDARRCAAHGERRARARRQEDRTTQGRHPDRRDRVSGTAEVEDAAGEREEVRRRVGGELTAGARADGGREGERPRGAAR